MNTPREKLKLKVVPSAIQGGSDIPWSKKEYDELYEGLKRLSKGKSYYFSLDLEMKVEYDDKEEA